MAATATVAADKAMAEFRGRPNRLGRARMFGDKTVGMDDPGMRAFVVLLAGLAPE
jgi:dihydroxyacetone kinase-like protein